MNGNSWAGELYRQHSPLVCACVCIWEREGEERRIEGRDSAAVARAVIQITAVLPSSDASHYFTCSLWFFLSTTHPLDPPRGNLQCCRDSLAAAASEGENRRNEREAEPDRSITLIQKREAAEEMRQGYCHIFFLSYLAFVRIQFNLKIQKWSIWLVRSLEELEPHPSHLRSGELIEGTAGVVWPHQGLLFPPICREKCSYFEWGLPTLPDN